MVDNSRLPEYESPPVVEVVCGVFFEPLHKILAPHLGLLWDKFRDQYPSCREAPPIIPVGGPAGAGELDAEEISEIPPLPRIWFVNEAEDALMQVQRDLLLSNWRKIRPEDAYPRYPTVKKRFLEQLGVFQEFIEENGLGEIKQTGYELSYVNHIPQGAGWAALDQIGAVFPDFGWRQVDRFLPAAESIDWRSSFRLPDDQGVMRIRIRTARHRGSDQRILVLEINTRGIGSIQTREGMIEWFDLAHDWIVRGFADVTDSQVQEQEWRKV